LILAGTGPVGIRAAILLAREGCEVYLSSRQLERAREVVRHISANNGVQITPLEIREAQDTAEALKLGINIVACCGAPGVQMLDLTTWSTAADLEIIADINAVNPLGAEGIKVTDNGKEREGKIIYGAIAIGNLKMKVHRAAVRTLFESNSQVLDFDSIYEIAKKTEA